MKTLKQIILISLIFPLIACGGKKVESLERPVSYMQNTPVIDGTLDADLKQLPARKFESKIKIHPFNKNYNLSYRLGYTNEYFYMYIEVEADTFICRDRGYQNGDGFVLMLSQTDSIEKFTDEFYVMGFSPQEEESKKWAKKILWYHNTNTTLRRLSDDIKLEYAVNDGKVGYEILIRWENLYPYHPSITEHMGINLAFVKAIG